MIEQSKIGRGLNDVWFNIDGVDMYAPSKENQKKYEAAFNYAKNLLENRPKRKRLLNFIHSITLKRQRGKTRIISKLATKDDLIIFIDRVHLTQYVKNNPDCKADKAFMALAMKGLVFFNPEISATWDSFNKDYVPKKYRAIWIDDMDCIQRRPGYSALVMTEQLGRFSNDATVHIETRTEDN